MYISCMKLVTKFKYQNLSSVSSLVQYSAYRSLRTENVAAAVSPFVIWDQCYDLVLALSSTALTQPPAGYPGEIQLHKCKLPEGSGKLLCDVRRVNYPT